MIGPNSYEPEREPEAIIPLATSWRLTFVTVDGGIYHLDANDLDFEVTNGWVTLLDEYNETAYVNTYNIVEYRVMPL